MKRLLYMFVGFSLTVCTPSQGPDLPTQLTAFNAAFEKGDVTALASMLTEDYVHTNHSWKSFGKTQWLQYMQSRSEKLAAGDLQIDLYQMDELAIQQHGSSAIVTARIEVRGTEDGTSFFKQFRVTHVWVQQEGRWLRAAFHDTRID